MGKVLEKSARSSAAVAERTIGGRRRDMKSAVEFGVMGLLSYFEVRMRLNGDRGACKYLPPWLHADLRVLLLW